MADFTPDEVQALKRLVSGILPGRAATPAGDALADHLLDKEWADKVIQKDPKRWKGAPMVGRHYSEAPADWLDMAAGALEYKVAQAKQDPTPRLQPEGRKDAGKPWYLVDEFEAKLVRAWARRNRQMPPAAESSAKAPTSQPSLSLAAGGHIDDDIPF